MNSVIFETDGLLDLRALVMFGVNSKPKSDSPIGYFGTGLKYALAVLARMETQVEIRQGNNSYSLYKETGDFRDKSFDFLFLKGNTTGSLIELPFTTELGKNWDIWMAYRELHSNTLDENGKIYLGNKESLTQDRDITQIIVTHDLFLDVFNNKDTIFLPNAMKGNSGVQIIDAPSKYIYYRGVRVYELEKKSVLTYNILHNIELTEDRTIKHSFYADWYIKQELQSNTSKTLLTKALTAQSKTYESELVYDIDSPSDLFKEVVNEKIGSNHINSSALTVVHKAEKKNEETYFSDWISLLSDAIERHDFDTVEQFILEREDEFLKFLARNQYK